MEIITYEYFLEKTTFYSFFVYLYLNINEKK
jgi:hypothetical protein